MGLLWCIHTSKGNITVPNTAAANAALYNFNKKQYFKIVFHFLIG